MNRLSTITSSPRRRGPTSHRRAGQRHSHFVNCHSSGPRRIEQTCAPHRSRRSRTHGRSRDEISFDLHSRTVLSRDARRQREHHASGWQQSRGCLREGRGHLTPVRLIRPKEILLCRTLPRTLCFIRREGRGGDANPSVARVLRGHPSSAFLQVSDNAHMPRDLPLFFP